MLRNTALSILLLSVLLLIGCGRAREAGQAVQAGRQLQQSGETTIKTDEGEVQIKTDKAGEQATITVEGESGEKHSVTIGEALDTSELSLAIYPGATQQGGQTTDTGAGKHPLGQLNLAKQMGIEVVRGDPKNNKPGRTIVIPQHPSQIEVVDVDLDRIRRSYLRNALKSLTEGAEMTKNDFEFLAADTKSTQNYVWEVVNELVGKTK